MFKYDKKLNFQLSGFYNESEKKIKDSCFIDIQNISNEICITKVYEKEDKHLIR